MIDNQGPMKFHAALSWSLIGIGVLSGFLALFLFAFKGREAPGSLAVLVATAVSAMAADLLLVRYGWTGVRTAASSTRAQEGMSALAVLVVMMAVHIFYDLQSHGPDLALLEVVAESPRGLEIRFSVATLLGGLGCIGWIWLRRRIRGRSKMSSQSQQKAGRPYE